MKEIPLTQGKVALVDDEDYERITALKWTANLQKRRGDAWYAARNDRRRGINRTILMHRVILDAPPGMQVDHVNGDGLDNRRSNLRLCSASENSHNARKRRGVTSSQFKGVTWRKDSQKWRARIRSNHRLILIGQFDTEEAAALAWNEAAIKYHGAFARLNNLETPP